MPASRERTIFTAADKQKLLDIITPLIDKLESKETGTRATLAKQETWGMFKSHFELKLKNVCKNMKIKAKKDSTKEKKERKKTGGGTAVVMGTMSQTIANLLPQQMDPAVADSLDCDASEASAEEDGAGEAEGATASTSAPPVNEEDDDEVNRMEDGAEQIPDAEQEPEINIVIGPMSRCSSETTNLRAMRQCADDQDHHTPEEQTR
ncbi:hypothetical protein CAPTEDRAFT_198277 [Capitella teleta]|uniref:Regulatory protein zeste n=1 Tax=Capitella teleta TaxID=283909 RepID=R7VM70_CAPTE|nr:hypothetical protein CAPTEDRAFT_198277 [Capitella teleta]|eukprot:ELU18325.1 hypothetical protein CAPTEDRAFT_198277 [Capitella teleta]